MFLPSISSSKKINMPHVPERETIYVAWELCAINCTGKQSKWWQETQRISYNSMSYNSSIFQILCWPQTYSDKHSANFLTPVIRGFVCLNYCRYKNLPAEAHSPMSQNKQAPTSWVNLIVTRAQRSEIICKLKLWWKRYCKLEREVVNA